MATYAHHNYPGGSVQGLLSHSGTSSNVRSKFEADVAAVLSEGKPVSQSIPTLVLGSK